MRIDAQSDVVVTSAELRRISAINCRVQTVRDRNPRYVEAYNGEKYEKGGSISAINAIR